ncbi:unnamed protein product [Heterobilharzia americana]|nr:unnamed protein product [Heterobilharzia americana]
MINYPQYVYAFPITTVYSIITLRLVALKELSNTKECTRKMSKLLKIMWTCLINLASPYSKFRFALDLVPNTSPQRIL